VQKEDSAGWLAALIKGNGQQRADSEFLQNGTGKPGQILDGPAVTAVPTKTPSRPNPRIPTKRRIHVVEQKHVGARKRQTLWDKPVVLSCLHAPQKNALKIRVTIEQKRLFGIKGQAQLLKEESQRLRQPLIHLHRGVDAREKLDLAGKVFVAI